MKNTVETVKLSVIRGKIGPMSKPYKPEIYFNCDDYDCCRDGSPQVICRFCKMDWPCEDYKANHTVKQVHSQQRWVVRVKHREEFPDLIEYNYRKEGIEA